MFPVARWNLHLSQVIISIHSAFRQQSHLHQASVSHPEQNEPGPVLAGRPAPDGAFYVLADTSPPDAVDVDV